MKKIIIGSMILTAGLLFTGCSAESLIGDDEDQFTSSALYLKDSQGVGVEGISYSCDGGYTSDGDLITSGSTSITGEMAVDYWPGYDLMCTITPINAPALYLYDIDGPISNADVQCDSYNGIIGEDGAIYNNSTDECTIFLTIN